MKKKRFLAMIIALVMIVGIMPTMMLSVSAAKNKGFAWPTPGFDMSCPFGAHPMCFDGIPDHTDGHGGIDTYATRGTAILAAHSGYIIEKKDNTSGGYGRYIEIQAENVPGFSGTTLYAHASSLTSKKEGDKVTQGEIIGYVGGSGFGSENGYGAHLHFEVYLSYNGTQVNPRDYVDPDDTGSTGGGTTTTPSSDNPYPVPTRNIYVTPGAEPFMSGEDVKYIQWGLNKLGYNCGEVDGTFGYGTESALESFQRANGLDVDGIFGPQSLSKMQQLLAGVTPPPVEPPIVPPLSDQGVIININSEYNPGTDVTLSTWAGFSIPANATVTILGSAVDPADGVRAYRVSYNGNIGWVSERYIRIITPEQYTVTLNQNGGTGGTGSATATYGSAMPSITSPTRTGYSFQGYYDTSASSGGTQYYAASGASARSWDKKANTTLYARWAAITYTIAYNANGGTGTTASSSHTYDTTKALTANGFSRDGYTFEGWATSAASAVKYDDKQSVTNLSATNGATFTLYAVWQADVPEVEEEDGIVTIDGLLNGIKLTAIMTEVGVKFDWTQISGNTFGYRIYRSKVQGDEGISITDFPISANLSQYVDVNVDPYTMYYYTIREVLAEASFDQVAVEITDEVLGNTSEILAIETKNILIPEIPDEDDEDEDDDDETEIPPQRIKSFILMEIDNPMMQVDGETMEIDEGRGTVPLNLNGRVVVPVRAIIETMDDGYVGWDDVERKVTIDANNHNVVMWLDRRDILVDGSPKEVDVAPQSINSRTMLPVRFVAENIGCQITWIGTTQQIIIVFYRLNPITP